LNPTTVFEILLPAPIPTVRLLINASLLKVFIPAIVWLLVKSTNAAVVAFTKAVVAICVSFVPAEAVGARGIPVKVGEARSALAESEVFNPSIFDCAIEAEDEMSASAIVPSVIFAEVIEASAIEVVNPVRPDPSPTNAVAETVPEAEIAPEVIVPVKVGETSGAFKSRAD
jgi:hypothetical protein